MSTVHKAKNVTAMTADKVRERVNKMRKMMEEKKAIVDTLHVYISKGNSKTNELVPSVSLIPVMACPNCKACSGLCYDVRNDCVYPTVQNTRANNQAIWECDPERYFDEIAEFAKTQRFFRWHIGGDIVNDDYLFGMIRVAILCPKCTFLAFTKNYRLINEFIKDGGILPSNMRIIFSCWYGMETPNPYEFPTSHPLFADGRTTAPSDAMFCTGNCSECAEHENGCFGLKSGEAVVFPAH